MRQKYHQGKYTIRNPQKYSGRGEPTFRSSWEYTFMNFCDDNPSVVAWASEPCKITYQNPLNGKVTGYVPDFVIVITAVTLAGLTFTSYVNLATSVSNVPSDFLSGPFDIRSLSTTPVIISPLPGLDAV